MNTKIKIILMEKRLKKAMAKAIINDGLVSFIIKDPMGMERFISEVKILG